MNSDYTTTGTYKYIREGGPYNAPVQDDKLAEVVYHTSQKIETYYGKDFKNRAGQEARALSLTLHKCAITCSEHPELSWCKEVKKLIIKTGQEIQKNIQSGNFTAAKQQLDTLQSKMGTQY